MLAFNPVSAVGDSRCKTRPLRRRMKEPRTPLRRSGLNGFATPLEFHRQPEPEPPVTLRYEADAEAVERHFLPTIPSEHETDQSA